MLSFVLRKRTPAPVRTKVGCYSSVWQWWEGLSLRQWQLEERYRLEIFLSYV